MRTDPRSDVALQPIVRRRGGWSPFISVALTVIAVAILAFVLRPVGGDATSELLPSSEPAVDADDDADELGDDAADDVLDDDAAVQRPTLTSVSITRDPFDPVVPEPVEQPDPDDPVDPDAPVDPDDPDAPVDPDDPDSPVDPDDPDAPVRPVDPDAPADPDDPACVGTEQVVCDGRVLTLEDLGTGLDGEPVAVIQVDTTLYEVQPGDTFAMEFRFVDVEDGCPRISYQGGAPFLLCGDAAGLK